ncbi:hypothetical protein [Caballeronia sp. Lep1P3]|uniref:hypothetical protein n=1 Tax=Caballeronia sp. Lep1P3 TaxID=2878150 RepID=UPI001FD47C7A|nr:hypothetical protein [Caballeronia sp. Lep1P3]
MDSYVGKPLPRNPLALAALYKEGLGRLWQNQKQAADALTRFGVKREDVNRALRLSSMPTDALMLFADCGINGRTARELIRIERAIGRAALEERAQAIAKEGKSRTELVQMLDDQSPVPPKRRRTPQVDLPSIRAQQYVNGIATNKWSTMTEAAKTEGWGKEMLFKSTMLAGLPPVITSLFEQKRFSLRNGETLLALIGTLGISKVTQNARKLAEQPGRRSSEQILNYLAGGPADADCKVKVQLVGDKVTFSFSFKARATRRDLVDVDQLQSLASFALGNLVELGRR